MTALGLSDFGPVQNNISFNDAVGTTRGIHAEPWDKWVSVATGRIFGAWVDLREGPSFGAVYTTELDPSKAIFVPRGVGNSYQTLEPDTAYTYLVNDHWSPDAAYSFLNLADEPGMLHRTDVVTIDLATKRKRVLTAATGRSDGAPRYSPDGRVIAYTSHDTERSHVDQGHLELIARSGGEPRAVGTAFDRAVANVQWAPDGRSLLVTDATHAMNDQDLYRLDLESGAREALPSDHVETM